MKRLEGKRCRVVVAMSGGVDSSTVAGLLVEAGHEVVGITMKLYDRREDPSEAELEGTCCSLDDVSDARRVAEHLGIPFYVGNYERVFKTAVVDAFVSAYVSGRTPNPCVRCNDLVKFRALLQRSKALGADFLATGHYARTVVQDDGSVQMWEGRDVKKDQSYFLAGIPKKSLPQVIFPLGDMTKEEVRAHAERLDLPVAQKAESQDICFIPDNDYASFIEGHAPERLAGAGPLVSVDGLRIGQHRGLHRYTIGQRRGLGVSAATPRYVVRIDPEKNAVVVGDREDAYSTGLYAEGASWLDAVPAEGARVRARIRHNHEGASGTVYPNADKSFRITFDEPVLAVTPGQQVVLYEGRRVLGAGTIEIGLGAREQAV